MDTRFRGYDGAGGHDGGGGHYEACDITKLVIWRWGAHSIWILRLFYFDTL